MGPDLEEAGCTTGFDTGAGLITDTDEIREIADIGVILLLFGIGLEFSLERLRYIWRSVVVGGAFQVGLTAVAVFIALGRVGTQRLLRKQYKWISHHIDRGGEARPCCRERRLRLDLWAPAP